MDYSIQTKKYEGPMELLMDLIHRNKIDISDISIFEITEQYVDYIDNMEKFDLDIASDFIDMASKLLEIKSRYILYLKYNLEEDEDPRKELQEKIEEYQKIREITDELREEIKEYEDRFYREKEEYLEEDDLDLAEISIESIKNIINKLFKEIDEQDTEEVLNKNQKLKEIIEIKNISVESRMDSIRNNIISRKKIKFSDLIKSGSKKEIIANFLAVLELIKLKEIVIKQKSIEDEILIEKKENSQEILIEESNIDKEYEKIERKANRRFEKKQKKIADNDVI
ncbi:segregation and condensation protein A [Peptostreptococcus russellii]|uniref:segregation and condensation protein A n=1 Tax=Peptostreptococcus russellii TaxID=215200 RepID=UPI000D0E92A9|nr:segregation/condensation protein A [Peptostreptococcus russellii]